MDDQKEQEARWRELAELLGLDENAPPAVKKEMPAVAPPPREPEAPAIKAYEEPPVVRLHPAQIEEEMPRTRFVEEPESPSIPITRDEPATEWEAEFDEEEEDDTPLEETVGDHPATIAEEELTEEEPASGPIGVVGEEEKPRRGRRRRRRGRRRGGDKAEGEAQPAARPAPETTPSYGARIEDPLELGPPPKPARGREPEQRDQRGRGRGGKRRDEPEPARQRPVVHERPRPEPAFEEDARPTPVAARKPVVEDDTDFSNWTVPSWQDLISSLYRPDR